jgi:hypothetical protein
MPASKTVNHSDMSPSSRAKCGAKHHRVPICTQGIKILSGKVLLGLEILHHFEAVDNVCSLPKSFIKWDFMAISTHITNFKKGAG